MSRKKAIAGKAPSAPVWEFPRRRDAHLHFEFRISHNTSIAFLFSILVHLLVLITFAPKLLTLGDPKSEADETMIVNLAPRATPKPSMPPPAAIESSPTPPAPKQAKPKRQLQQKPQPDASTNRIIALEKPAPGSVPLDRTEKPLDTRIPVPPAPPPPAPGAPTDMLSYINAKRAQRQAEQGVTVRDSIEIAARDNPISEDERRSAIIRRNMQMDGGNGIFQIRELGSSHARFSFLGWKRDFTNARQELVDVEVGPQDDIHRAMVRKMIEIIRRDYQGDFQWESRRLGRVVTLSARQEDSAGLEDFLITEFFGVAGVVAR